MLRQLSIIMILILPTMAKSGTNGRLIDKSGLGFNKQKAIIWISEYKRFKTKKSKKHYMSQLNKKFAPGIVAVRKGDTVVFENKDKIFHNVFSLNKGQRFDLGVYKGRVKYSGDFKKVIKQNVVPKKTFNKLGKVNLFCNIHSAMNGLIFVFDHPYYSIVSKTGTFKLPTLPPGKYKYMIDGKNFKKPFSGLLSITAKPLQIKINLRKLVKNKNSTKKESNNAIGSDDEFY